jgi:hypothetical protein
MTVRPRFWVKMQMTPTAGHESVQCSRHQATLTVVAFALFVLSTGLKHGWLPLSQLAGDIKLVTAFPVLSESQEE